MAVFRLVVKQGSVGKRIRLRLLDSKKKPIDATDFDVQFIVTPKGRDLLADRVIDAAMTAEDQTQAATMGYFYYPLTIDDVALPVGIYDFEAVATGPSGAVDKFPTVDPDGVYPIFGELVMEKAK